MAGIQQRLLLDIAQGRELEKMKQQRTAMRCSIKSLNSALANARARILKVQTKLDQARLRIKAMERQIGSLEKQLREVRPVRPTKKAMGRPNKELQKALERAERQAAKAEKQRQRATAAEYREEDAIRRARKAETKLARLQQKPSADRVALAEALRKLSQANQALELFRRSGPHGGYVRTRAWVHKEIYLRDGKTEVLAFERPESATDAVWAAHDVLTERGCIVHIQTHKDVPRPDYVHGPADRHPGHIPIIRIVLNRRECTGLVAFRDGEPAAIATGKLVGPTFIEDGGFVDLERFLRGQK